MLSFASSLLLFFFVSLAALCCGALSSDFSGSNLDFDLDCHDVFGNQVILTESLIGDDYCDCFDTGIDERGYTSACAHLAGAAHVHFQCGAAVASSSGGMKTVLPRNTSAAQSIPHSRVNDSVCDCCDGSDEAAGLCPNTCDAFFGRLANYKQAVLKGTIKGFRMYKKSESETAKKMASMKSKLSDLVNDERATYDLANFVTLYISKEKRYSSSILPRIDYKIQGERIRKIKGGESRLSADILALLRTKCPTYDFTFDDYLATYSLKQNDPRRRVGKNTAIKGLISTNRLLEDPGDLALRIIGTAFFSPVRYVAFSHCL